MHPIIALVLLIAVLAIFLLPREQILVPLLATMMLIPMGQVLVIGGVHFPATRILGVCALCRLGGKAKLPNGFTLIDYAFLFWSLACAVSFVLQYETSGALINRVGFLADAIGGYFSLRLLIDGEAGVQRCIRVFAFISLIVALVMLGEHLLHHNVVGMLGGVKSDPEIKDGKLRAQGVFQHPLLAGAFGATIVPLFLGVWKRARKTAALGFVCATGIVVAASSSTPLLAYSAGVIALSLWSVRGYMRELRWALVVTLVTLHICMKAPVWALIARIDLTGSSSGYHRYMLVENCIRHIADWWLIGTPTYNTWGWDMWDLCNQYVAYSVTGGLATVGLFVLMIVRCYSRLGIARKSRSNNSSREWLVWTLCAALSAHVVGFFGVGYFDQTEIAWYALLAMINAVPLRPVKRGNARPRSFLNGEALIEEPFASEPVHA